MVPQETSPATSQQALSALTILKVVAALLLFFIALELLIFSFQQLGTEEITRVLNATSNPFMGLFIGLVGTAMIQSSSTTTAITIALVGAGSLSLTNAVPVIMGANVGTTITALLVSLASVNKTKEFKRAVSAGAYHCFFNLLSVLILFPLEDAYGLLSSLSSTLANSLAATQTPTDPSGASTGSVFRFALQPLISVVSNPYVLVFLAAALLFGSIVYFRRIISQLLRARSPEAFSRFFFKSPFKSFAWGVVTTAAIRSSTITTSVVVPIVGKRIVKLREAAPFIMGANIGTTVTGFIAVLVNSDSPPAVSIAIAHFLFNLIGVVVFFMLPFFPRVPYYLAKKVGSLCAQRRFLIVVFVLLTFFIIPFALIYISR